MKNWSDFFRSGERGIFNQCIGSRGLIELLLSHVPKGGSILEIGCGTALLSVILADFGFQVTASDTDAEVIECAKKRVGAFNLRVSIVKADILNLSHDLGGQKFDLVCSKGVMEHFSDEQIIRGLKEQKKIAKIIIFHVPNSRLKVNDNFFGDERLLSNSKWVSLIKHAGFSKISVFGDYDLRRWCYILPAFLWHNKFSFWWKYLSRHSIFICE